MDTNLMTATVNKYIQALNEHDMSIIEDIFDKDAAIEDPAGSEPKAGITAIKEMYAYAFKMNVTAEMTGPVRCAGNRAAFAFFIVLDREEGKMKLEPIDLFEFNDEGKVRSMKAYWGPENCSML